MTALVSKSPDEVKKLRLYKNGKFVSIEDPMYSYFEPYKGVVLNKIDLSEIGLGIVRYLGRGASSIVVTDEKKAYKISHHQEDDFSVRDYTIGKMKDMDGLLIPFSIISYASYKRYEERERKRYPLPPYASYSRDIKAFATYYAFDTLDVHLREDGIIVQDLVPKDSKPTSDTPRLTREIAHMARKIYGIHLDIRGADNMFFKEISPRSMIYRKDGSVKKATWSIYLVDM
jgi:hypothetical protein